ncbi:MAG: gliding motility protein GldC [Saprospiraceae bacterium]|nr:gliding motility protein GldC [Saprospiraceae bacterium]
MTSNKIEIEVNLDEKKLPETINWTASGSPTADAKAMMLAFFDRDTRDTLRIDLWTKDMQVQEMDRFFYQTLRSMADSYLRSTNNKEIANDMRKFVQHFGESTGIIPK